MPATQRDADFAALSYQGPWVPGQMVEDHGVGIGASAYGSGGVTIDGTPSRVAGLLLVAGGVLAALRVAGFRFNVGVTS